MGVATPPEAGGDDDAVTQDDMLKITSGRADDETKQRVVAQLQQEGSYAREWLSRMRSALHDPFDVDMRKLREAGDNETEDSEEEAA